MCVTCFTFFQLHLCLSLQHGDICYSTICWVWRKYMSAAFKIFYEEIELVHSVGGELAASVQIWYGWFNTLHTTPLTLHTHVPLTLHTSHPHIVHTTSLTFHTPHPSHSGSTALDIRPRKGSGLDQRAHDRVLPDLSMPLLYYWDWEDKCIRRPTPCHTEIPGREERYLCSVRIDSI